MKEIKKLNHIRFGEIATIELNNSILFNAMDVLRVLGYQNPDKVLLNLCKKNVKCKVLTEKGPREWIFIPESEVYRLVGYSNITDVYRFLDWIDECIHPTLFKSRNAVSEKQIEDILNDPETIIRLATHLKNEQQSRMEIEKQYADHLPKVLFASAVEASRRSILVGELAKILRQNGVKIGQNRLFQWLREHNYLGKSGERYNHPTQRSMDLGLFEIKKTTITKPDGTILVATTPKITGKGQIYFMNKFLPAS